MKDITPQEAVDKLKETGWDCHIVAVLEGPRPYLEDASDQEPCQVEIIEQEKPLLIQGGHSRDLVGWVYGYEDAFAISNGGTKNFICMLPDKSVFETFSLEHAVDEISASLKEESRKNKEALDTELSARIKELDEGTAKTISYEDFMDDMKGWDKKWDKKFKKRLGDTFDNDSEFGSVISGTRIQVSSFLRALKDHPLSTVALFSGITEEKLQETLEVLAISLVHRTPLP